MRNDKPNLMVDLTFQFSLDVIKFIDELEISRKFVFANQILKAGTSIGAC
jgi:four helix bundle protein